MTPKKNYRFRVFIRIGFVLFNVLLIQCAASRSKQANAPDESLENHKGSTQKSSVDAEATSADRRESAEYKALLSLIREQEEKLGKFDEAQEKTGYPDGRITRLFSSELDDTLYALDYAFDGDHPPVTTMKFEKGSLWSSDDGDLWSSAEPDFVDGFAMASPMSLAEDLTRKVMYISTGDGTVYAKKPGRGQTWEMFTDRVKTGNEWIDRLVVHAATGDLYARVVNNGFGIYQLKAGTKRWLPMGENLPDDWSTGDLAIDAQTDELFIVHTEAGFVRIDGRKTQERLGIRKNNMADIYAWSPESIPTGDDRLEPFFGVEADPKTGAVYALAYDGLYVHNAAGAWKKTFDVPFVWRIAFESRSPYRALLISMNSTYIRQNGQWHRVDNIGWHADTTIYTALFHHGKIFVGSNDGLFVSENEGEEWSRVRVH